MLVKGTGGVRVYIRVCTYVCVYVCKRIYTNLWCVCWGCLCVGAYIYSYVHVFMYNCTCVRRRTAVRVYVYTLVQIFRVCECECAHVCVCVQHMYVDGHVYSSRNGALRDLGSSHRTSRPTPTPRVDRTRGRPSPSRLRAGGKVSRRPSVCVTSGSSGLRVRGTRVRDAPSTGSRPRPSSRRLHPVLLQYESLGWVRRSRVSGSFQLCRPSETRRSPVQTRCRGDSGFRSGHGLGPGSSSTSGRQGPSCVSRPSDPCGAWGRPPTSRRGGPTPRRGLMDGVCCRVDVSSLPLETFG